MSADRLMASVAEEYLNERQRLSRLPDQKLAERVQFILTNRSVVDVEDIEYNFDGWHIAMIASGQRGEPAVHAIAAAFDRRLLTVRRDRDLVWAWLGARHRSDPRKFDKHLRSILPSNVSVAVGGCHTGLDGWRLSHQEAQAGFLVMRYGSARFVYGSEVALVAAVLRDEALAKSLLQTYLTPLDGHGHSGRALRDTLRAYFAAGNNAATAAAALGVNRQTVQRRLRKVETTLDRLLDSCHAELEVALRLEQLASEKLEHRATTHRLSQQR